MWRKVNLKIPKRGYILTLWRQSNAYRATAVAYMQREGLKQVEHANGTNYFLNELKEAML